MRIFRFRFASCNPTAVLRWGLSRLLAEQSSPAEVPGWPFRPCQRSVPVPTLLRMIVSAQFDPVLRRSRLFRCHWAEAGSRTVIHLCGSLVAVVVNYRKDSHKLPFPGMGSSAVKAWTGSLLSPKSHHLSAIRPSGSWAAPQGKTVDMGPVWGFTPQAVITGAALGRTTCTGTMVRGWMSLVFATIAFPVHPCRSRPG